MKPRDALKKTWGKRWAKQWANEHLEHVQVTNTFAGSFGQCFTKCFEKPPELGWALKPNNSTHSRGVTYVSETDDLGPRFYSERGFWSRSQHAVLPLEKPVLVEELQKTLDKPVDAFQWLVEPLIEADPDTHCLFSVDGVRDVCEDYVHPPPVFRAIIWKGRFHFGEIHVPTKKSGGVGSLRRGAIRYVFDHRGVIVEPPQIDGAPTWIPQCDGRADKSLYERWSVPGWFGVLKDIEEHVVPTFGHRALYAFDFLIDDDVPVFLEIEHSPNVKYLTQFRGFQ